jgi:hypothetical protein
VVLRLDGRPRGFQDGLHFGDEFGMCLGHDTSAVVRTPPNAGRGS